MADEFLDVGIETDEQTLADGAIDRLRAAWVGWEPDEGDLEVIATEAWAAIAADAAAVAAVVPSAVFRTFLEQLHGVVYTAGSPATTTVTFHLADSDPHLIPEGSEIDIDGFAFRVDNDVDTAGLLVGGVAVTAAVDGTDANGLAGDVVTPVSALAFVESIDVDTPTAGGSNAESDADYQDRGSRELELQAKTLVTARDYELMALSQPAVGRVIAVSDAATREIQVYAATPTGDPLPGPEADALAASYEEFRLSNWNVSMEDATVTTIGVTYTIHPYPGFDAADLLARADAELALFLDRASWGHPREFGDSTTWLVEPRVRKNKVIDLLGDVEGVDYVGDVTLTGSAGTIQSNGDWLMPGTVPLADAGVIAGSIV